MRTGRVLGVRSSALGGLFRLHSGVGSWTCPFSPPCFSPERPSVMDGEPAVLGGWALWVLSPPRPPPHSLTEMMHAQLL